MMTEFTYRTVPGRHPEKGMFFTRGTSRTQYAVYTENGEEYEFNMLRLAKKWVTALQHIPKPIETTRDDLNIVGIIHFGTSMAATHEAIDQLITSGIAANDLRLLAFPFHDEVRAFIDKHEQVFVVEQNRDGQMRRLLVNELEIDPARLISIVHFNGDPISAGDVLDKLQPQLKQQSSTNTVDAAIS